MRIIELAIPTPQPGEPVPHYLDRLMPATTPLQQQLVQIYGLAQTIVMTSRMALRGEGVSARLEEVFDGETIKTARDRFALIQDRLPKTSEQLASKLETPNASNPVDTIVSGLRLQSDFAEETVARLNTTMSDLAAIAQSTRRVVKEEIPNQLRSIRPPLLERARRLYYTARYGRQAVNHAIEAAISRKAAEIAQQSAQPDQQVSDAIEALVQRSGIKEDPHLYKFEDLTQKLFGLLAAHGISPIVVALATDIAIENYYNPHSGEDLHQEEK